MRANSHNLPSPVVSCINAVRSELSEADRRANHDELTLLQNAYQVLSDPRRRKLYDQSLQRHGPLHSSDSPSPHRPTSSPSVPRHEVPSVDDESWSESFRYGLHSVAQKPPSELPTNADETADSFASFARGVRSVVDMGDAADWRAAWHKAHFGPDLRGYALTELPPAFELEVRNHPRLAPDLIHVTSAQTLLGRITLRQSTLLPGPDASPAPLLASPPPPPPAADPSHAFPKHPPQPPLSPSQQKAAASGRRSVWRALWTSPRSPRALADLLPSMCQRTETLELWMEDATHSVRSAVAVRRPLDGATAALVGRPRAEDLAADDLGATASVIEVFSGSELDRRVMGRYFEGRWYSPEGRGTHRRIHFDLILSSAFHWFSLSPANPATTAAQRRRPIPVARGTHTLLLPQTLWLWPPRDVHYAKERYYIEWTGPRKEFEAPGVAVPGEAVALVSAFEALDRERIGRLHRRALRLLLGWAAG